MTPAELGALARRAQAGDSTARHELLVELYGAVRKHVYLILGGGAIADDAVQEVMIALYRGLPAFAATQRAPGPGRWRSRRGSPTGCAAGSRDISWSTTER